MLAFGDSITNGGGELQWGVALQSWALWVARGLGVPFTSYAVDGAFVADVVRTPDPGVRALGRQPGRPLRRRLRLHRGQRCPRAPVGSGRVPSDHRFALAFVTARCERTLAVTAPLRLGVPPAGAKVGDLNAAIEANARRSGALVVDLSTFEARNFVMADRVHPTAFGQVSIAERALAVLARDGLPTRVEPASLVRFETTRLARLRGDLTYAYRYAKQLRPG